MKKLTKQELDEIIARHWHWLMEDCKGWEDMRADLSDTDLRGADLRGVNLQDADLYKADLRGADLRGVDLQDADLRGTNLSHANLYHADLRNAHLRDVDLHGADLREANLANALLAKADLTDAKLPEGEEYRMGVVLVHPILGYKRTAEGIILTAEIPAGATVFCINGGKCRTDRAKIISTEGHAVLHSMYVRPPSVYREGQEVVINDFDTRYNIECASGFHFFRARKEAEDYR